MAIERIRYRGVGAWLRPVKNRHPWELLIISKLRHHLKWVWNIPVHGGRVLASIDLQDSQSCGD